MKKFLSLVFVAIMGVLCIAPIFAVRNQANATSIEEAKFDENLVTNKSVVVDIDKNNISGLISAYVVENSIPFDEETKTMMPGVSIEPSSNNYGEVNSNYPVNPFSVNENQSLYMWIFIPDENIYSLSITLKTEATETIKWSFNYLQMVDILQNVNASHSIYGWKLFEFTVSQAEKSIGENTLEDLIFVNFGIEYTDEFDTNDRHSKNNLLFYNVYVADSFGSSSKVLKTTKYSNFKVDTNFYSNFNNVYIGDSITLSSKTDIFEYVYVGRRDLKNDTDNNYTWNIEISKGDEEPEIYDFGTPFDFDEKGFYSINITIKEYRASGSVTVVNVALSTYCEQFSLGGFSNVNYVLNYGETKQIYFNISQKFVFAENEEIIVKSTSGSVVKIESYEIINNKCYMYISGVNSGSANIVITAKGRKAGDTVDETFTSQVKVSVNEKTQDDTQILILWIVLGIYLAGFIVFGVISFVKARKVGVK